jgi:hypothetical protein
MRAALLLIVAALATLPAADPLDGLDFVDGKQRTAASFAGQTVVIVYFCGHCPNAASFLGGDGKAMHDWIEHEKLPVTLVLATPEFKPATLKDLDKERGYGMTSALYAHDPLNRENISLQNILQCRLLRPDGRVDMLPWRDTAAVVQQQVTAQNAGAFVFPPADITDAQAKELWWGIERGKPKAIKNLVAAGKAGKGADVAKLLERVKAREAELQDAAVAAAPTFAAVEALEAFMTETDGLDLKKAQARYKELKAMKELKDEFKARDIYQQCSKLIASSKSSDQQSGKEGMAMLAKKFPATTYGAKANETR